MVSVHVQDSVSMPPLTRIDICLERFTNFVFKPDVKYCAATDDGFLCWPPTEAGDIASQGCPLHRLTNANNDAFRICNKDGLWLGRKHNESSFSGWTNFTPCFHHDVRSLLTRVYDDELEREKFAVAENTRITEIIGFSLSLVALILSLRLFSHFRTLLNNRTRIHQSLFTAMTVQVIVRLILYIDQAWARSRMANGATGADYWSIENMPYLCEASYVLLEYASSVMFMWMFIEGLYLHNVVTGNALRESQSLRLYYVLGWGLPVITTGLWTIMTHLHYKHEPAISCWYGYNFSPLYWIIQGPRLAVILINLVFLLNIMRVLIVKLRRSECTEIVKVRKAVRAALVLLPLLGITNILNMIEPPLSPIWRFALWSYVTHFLRSFQGFFIAFIYCFMNAEVRAVVKRQYNAYKTIRTAHIPQGNGQNRQQVQESLNCCGNEEDPGQDIELAVANPPAEDRYRLSSHRYEDEASLDTFYTKLRRSEAIYVHRGRRLVPVSSLATHQAGQASGGRRPATKHIAQGSQARRSNRQSRHSPGGANSAYQQRHVSYAENNKGTQTGPSHFY